MLLHARLIATAALLVGCAQTHDPESPETVRTDAGDGADASAGGAGLDLSGVTRCAPFAHPEVLAVGPEPGCVSATFPLHVDDVCDDHAETFRQGHSGSGVRVTRAAAGAVWLRTSGCPVSMQRMSDRHCGRCSLRGGGAVDPSTTGVDAIAPDGVAEMLLVPETDAITGALLEPCDLTVEVCFDPEYGPPPWAP